ncbi:MAG TPA: Do family serine endopeptidase [Rhizomicrobium sp.]|jgi:serine protease Do|nr:Do family serine endopeptidase [Rhizomicrobium sp.]
MINRSMVIAGVIGGLVSLAGYQIVSETSQPTQAQPGAKTAPLPPASASIKALPQAATAVPQSAGQVQLTFAPVVRRVAPAVVNVYSRSVVRQQVNPIFSDPLFQQFFGVSPEMRQRVQQSLGSGVIVRPDGVIITNRHVIEGGQDIVVVLSDKREFKARVLLSDARTDLAVLRIDTHGERLPTIQFGDSDRVQVGDLVLAIGDPFGVGQTVTMGIVSALARTGVGASDYQFFIQTDAAVNPGNSGGALVTTDGKLAGINTAIVSRTGEYAGIGFAIPANLARRVVEGALGGGFKVPWIGASGQAVTSDVAQGLGLGRPGGVILKNVYPSGPAANAGLHSGDVVLDIDGTPVDDMQALNFRLATHKPGDTTRLHVRTGGNTHDVDVKLALPPENPARNVTTISGRNPLTGAKVENLSPAVNTELQLDLMARGVVVLAPGDSIAAQQGFQSGDIVRAINGTEIHSVNELNRALANAGGQWDMIIDRGGQQIHVTLAG